MKHTFKPVFLRCGLVYLCVIGLIIISGSATTLGTGCGTGVNPASEEAAASGGELIAGITLSGTVDVPSISASISKSASFASSSTDNLATAELIDGTDIGNVSFAGGSFSIVMDPAILAAASDKTILVKIKTAGDEVATVFALVSFAGSTDIGDTVTVTLNSVSTVATALVYYTGGGTPLDAVGGIANPLLTYNIYMNVFSDTAGETVGGTIRSMADAVSGRFTSEGRGLTPAEVKALFDGNAAIGALNSAVGSLLTDALVDTARTIGEETSAGVLGKFFKPFTSQELTYIGGAPQTTVSFLQTSLADAGGAATAFDRGIVQRSYAHVYDNDDCTDSNQLALGVNWYTGMREAIEYQAGLGMDFYNSVDDPGAFGRSLCNFSMAAGDIGLGSYLTNRAYAYTSLLSGLENIFDVADRTSLSGYVWSMTLVSEPGVGSDFPRGNFVAGVPCPDGFEPNSMTQCVREDDCADNNGSGVGCIAQSHGDCKTGFRGSDGSCSSNNVDCCPIVPYGPEVGSSCEICTDCASLRCVDFVCVNYFECGEAGQPECPCDGVFCMGREGEEETYFRFSPACEIGGGNEGGGDVPSCTRGELCTEEALGEGEPVAPEAITICEACFAGDGSADADTSVCLQTDLCALDDDIATCQSDIASLCGE